MQDKQYVMALDAGTTSNRAIIFDNESHIVSVSQKEFTQYFPKPGWVEHDANEIFHSMVEVMREALEQANMTRRSSGTRTQATPCTTPSYGSPARPRRFVKTSKPAAWSMNSVKRRAWSSMPTSRARRSNGFWTMSKAPGKKPKKAISSSGPSTAGWSGN